MGAGDLDRTNCCDRAAAVRAEHEVGIEDAVHQLMASGMHGAEVLVLFPRSPPSAQSGHLPVVEVV